MDGHLARRRFVQHAHLRNATIVQVRKERNMINALLAHSFRAVEVAIPWQIVPMVFLGLIAVCAVFKGIYWVVGKMGIE